MSPNGHGQGHVTIFKFWLQSYPWNRWS